jgi:hypothetical protein
MRDRRHDRACNGVDVIIAAGARLFLPGRDGSLRPSRLQTTRHHAVPAFTDQTMQANADGGIAGTARLTKQHASL